MVPVMLFPMLNVLYSHSSTLCGMYAVPNMAVSVVPSFCAFSVCCSGIFLMILRQFQLPLLLLVSLLVLQLTCPVFLL